MPNLITRTRHADALTPVLELADRVDLPDPALTWWTSSVSENHPGKKFHYSSWCPRLAKVKHKLTTTRPYSEVGSRTCYECEQMAGGDQAVLGRATHQTTTLVAALRSVVDAPDRASIDERISVLGTMLKRPLPAKGLDLSAHQLVWAAVTSAFNDISVAHAQDNHSTELVSTLSRTAALHLLCRPGLGSQPGTAGDLTEAPNPNLDLRLLGAGRPGTPAPCLRDAWKAFRQAVLDRRDLTEARQAAAAAALPLRDAHQVSQLPDSFTIPAGVTEVSLADLLAQWRTEATSLTERALDEWVQRVENTLAVHADLGEVTVELTADSPKRRYGSGTPGASNWILDGEVKKFAEAWPYQLTEVPGVRRLTVPVVIAAWLVKFARHNDFTCRLKPHGSNTDEVISVAAHLRDNDPEMTLATAFAAARGIQLAA